MTLALIGSTGDAVGSMKEGDNDVLGREVPAEEGDIDAVGAKVTGESDGGSVGLGLIVGIIGQGKAST